MNTKTAYSRFSTTFDEHYQHITRLLPIDRKDNEHLRSMNIIIDGDAMPATWHQDVARLFGVRARVRNRLLASKRAILTFSLDGVTLNLIPVPRERLQYALRYYSYPGLSSVLRVLYRSVGLHYETDGLTIRAISEDGTELLSHPVLLTSGFEMAMCAGGLDPQIFHKGFEKEEDLFQFVASSPYFHPDLYLGAGRRKDNLATCFGRSEADLLVRFEAWCRSNRSKLDSRAAAHHREHVPERMFKMFPGTATLCAHAKSRAESKIEQERRLADALEQHAPTLKGARLCEFALNAKKSFQSTDIFYTWLSGLTDQELASWLKARHSQYRLELSERVARLIPQEVRA